MKTRELLLFKFNSYVRNGSFFNVLQDLKRLHTHLVLLLIYFAENNLGTWVGTWLFTVLKVPDLFYVGLESDVPARKCKCVLSDAHRRTKGWRFI